MSRTRGQSRYSRKVVDKSCIVSDLEKDDIFKGRLRVGLISDYQGEIENTIDEWKQKWNTPTVTYGLTNDSISFPDSSFEIRALAIALRTWQLRIKDIRFKRIYNTSAETPDIPLRFLKAEDDSLFTEKPSVLAYAYFPSTSVIGGDITFNDSKIWTKDGRSIDAEAYTRITGNQVSDPTNRFKTYNIIHTMIHECGHAIGLKHNNDCWNCVMYPYYNERVRLHDNDIERIQAFYGKRGISARWIDYFRNRMFRRFGSSRWAHI